MGYPAMEDRALLLLLRGVHRHIGLLEQLLSRAPVLGIKRNTDTGLYLMLHAVDLACFGDAQSDSYGEGRDVRFLPNFEHQEEKLISAATADRVATPNEGLQSLTNHLKDSVADIVPVRIVHSLELVEVDEHHCQSPRMPLCLR